MSFLFVLIYLGQKKGENIFAGFITKGKTGNNIIVKIIKVRGSKIKIGIEAPNNVAIARTESDDDKTIDCCLHKNIVNEVE